MAIENEGQINTDIATHPERMLYALRLASLLDLRYQLENGSFPYPFFNSSPEADGYVPLNQGAEIMRPRPKGLVYGINHAITFTRKFMIELGDGKLAQEIFLANSQRERDNG